MVIERTFATLSFSFLLIIGPVDAAFSFSTEPCCLVPKFFHQRPMLFTTSLVRELTQLSSDKNERGSNSEGSRGRYGFNHGGGRSSRQRIPKLRERDKKPGNLISRLVPWLLVAVVLSRLFAWGLSGNEPSVYFYQSSSFETQVFKSDGNVESARKESIRTNVPSLLQEKISAPRQTRGFGRWPNQEFERELNDEIGKLNDEIDGMNRFERKIFDEFL